MQVLNNVNENLVTGNNKLEGAGSQCKKMQDSYKNGVASAVFYGVCSTSMAFINKAVVSSYKFHFPFFIMANQMTVSIVILEIFRCLGLIYLPKYSLAQGISLFWPSIFYAMHSVSALNALSGMSIPMYAAIKRCAPIVTLILSVILLKKPPPNFKITVAVILITVGCFMAGLGDLQFDTKAYGYGTFSVIVQGLYLTLVQKGAENMSALQILHINSYNTLPIFIVISLFFDTSDVINYEGFADVGFLACFSVQVIMGVLLNFSLFICTAENSALTTSLIGVMKSVLQTVVGSFTFGGIKFNFLTICGIALNSNGGILYVIVKYREKQKMFLKTKFSSNCSV